MYFISVSTVGIPVFDQRGELTKCLRHEPARFCRVKWINRKANCRGRGRNCTLLGFCQLPTWLEALKGTSLDWGLLKPASSFYATICSDIFDAFMCSARETSKSGVGKKGCWVGQATLEGFMALLNSALWEIFNPQWQTPICCSVHLICERLKRWITEKRLQFHP